jgi:hypothetical protein
MHPVVSRAAIRATRAIAIGAALLVALATGACTQTAESATPARPAPQAISAFQHRAVQVAREWEASGTAHAWRSGFVPLEPLSKPGADVGFTMATKRAFLEGRYAFAAPTWPTTPSHGRIAFDSGTTMTVRLQSAADAYAQLAAHPAECSPAIEPSAPAPPDGGAGTTGGSAAPGGAGGSGGPSSGCVRLRITHVELGSFTVLTSRGHARVPAWLFTVDGLGAPIARVAVAPSAIALLPTPPASVQLPGVAGADSVISVDGRTITFRIMVSACAHGFEPLVYETATSVVVGGTAIPDPGVTACPAIGVMKPVVAQLAEPLGNRLVLDVIGGQPLVIAAYPPTGPTS